MSDPGTLTEPFGASVQPLVGHSPPFENPVLIFGLAMVIFLVAPLVVERYQLPGIIGVILVGAIVGPNGLGFLMRSDTIVLLGTVGLVYLIFLAALEIDLNQFTENRNQSIAYGFIGFALPQAAGMIVGVTLLDFGLSAAALYAAVFSSHTLLAYPVINRLGIVTNEAVTAVVGGTIISDTLALLVLAIVVGSVEGQLDARFWLELGLGLAIFLAIVWFLVPRVTKWFFRNLDEENNFNFLFVLGVLFVSAYLAELAGFEHIIGAFLAGLVLNRLIPKTGTLMSRLEFVGNTLFIPFFLLSVGMLIDPDVLVAGPGTWVIAGSILVILAVTKLAATGISRYVYDYTTAEQMTMFGLTAGQAAASLAITLIGFDIGLFDDRVVNGVIVMILIVSVASPFLTRRYGRKISEAKEQDQYDPAEAPRRILVAFQDATDQIELLLDFGMLVRESYSDEPLHALSVVQRDTEEPDSRSGPRGADGRQSGSDDERPESDVAETEEFLVRAEEYVTSADVPIETHIGIDKNVVTGIGRTVEENRITTLVLGWRGSRSLKQYLFGSTIDRILDQTTELVFVTKLREELNVTDRVVLVLPERIASHPGFYEAVHAVKTISSQLGVPLTCLVTGDETEKYERLVTAVEPELTVNVAAIEGGRQLASSLDERTDPSDLVVATSPRKGARGWRSTFRNYPNQLEKVDADNVAMVYPAEEDVSDKRRFLHMS